MMLHISFTFMLFLLSWEYRLIESFEASPLNHIRPSYKILNDWRAQTEWEERHDMKAIEDFLSNAYRNLIEFSTSDDERNRTSCVMSLAQLGIDLVRKEKYALQVVDGAGKVGSGIMLGNVRWYGQYYECLKAKSQYFDTKWCKLSVGQQSQVGANGNAIGMAIGMCLPDSCSEDYLNQYLHNILPSLNSSTAVSCPIQPTAWTATDILSITVFSLLLVLIIVGTVIEYYILWKHNEEANILSVNSSDIQVDLDGQKPRKNSVLTEILLCFSAIRNTNAILATNSKSDTIKCLHGIRFLSISWVVLGHTYLFTLLYSANVVDVADWFSTSFSFQVVANGFYSVDSFFFLSGLLVTYLCLKESSNFQGKHIPMLYLQRYLRLTPTFAFLILVSVGFYGKLGDGPLWPDAYMSGKTVCDKYWWTNMLYINNLHPPELVDECLGVAWYLANDMQFFLLAPISILLIKWRPQIGINVLVFGIFSSVLVTGIISAHFKEQPPVVGIAVIAKMISNGGIPKNGSYGKSNFALPPKNPVEAFWSDLYAKPWCRIGVYLVGMLTGYFLQATKMKIKISKIFVALGWALAFALNISLVYGLWWYSKEAQPMAVSLAAFYNAMSRPMWGVGLGWLVIACASGYGGPINTFLSWKLFIPLSRLTFCIYLIHLQIIAWWHSTQEATSYYSNTEFAFYFMGSLVCSVAAAYVLSLLVEMPFVNLGKMLLRKREENNRVQNGYERLLVREEDNPES